MHYPKSAHLYQEALTHIAGGVNSPSRSFKAVGGTHPLFMARGEGAYFYDVDGNRFIDYLAAYGPIILGHAHPQVTAALIEAAQNGTLYGTPTEREVTFARLLKSLIPAMDKVRFVNSGTEAVMTTVRLARAYTGRNKIIKFAGCYHGHFDAVLVAAGSGPSTLGTPDSAGITDSTAKEIITVPFNDIPALEAALTRWGEEVAAVMIEPIVGNFGIVTPHPGYLEQLCQLSRANGSLVIYDEVISAFRFHYGAAHTHPMFDDHEAIRPDLVALGKIIGGGLPIGAYGGRDEIMRQIAPEGTAYQAGTMAGNPASMAAGIACIEALGAPDTYAHLERLGERLQQGLQDAASQAGIPLQVNRLCGALSTHFYDGVVTNYEQAKQADGDQFARFFMGMLHEGICLAPSKYEAWFLTTAHQAQDIEITIEAANIVLQKLNERQ